MTIKAQQKSPSLRVLMLIILGLWMIIAAFPFLWTVWGSLKVEGDFFSKANWMWALTGKLTQVQTGGSFTGLGYQGAWVQEEFWRAALNSAFVCIFVVTISLTFGTLGGYALSRSTHRYAFWFLIIALIFRALPPITLVSPTTTPVP